MIFENKIVRRSLFAVIYVAALIFVFVTLGLSASGAISACGEAIVFAFGSLFSVGLIHAGKDLLAGNALGKLLNFVGHLLFYGCVALTLLPLSSSYQSAEVKTADKCMLIMSVALNLVAMIHYTVLNRFYEADGYIKVPCFVMVLSVLLVPLSLAFSSFADVSVDGVGAFLSMLIAVGFCLAYLLSICEGYSVLYTILGAVGYVAVLGVSVIGAASGGSLFSFMAISAMVFMAVLFIIAKKGGFILEDGVLGSGKGFIIYFFASLIIEIVLSCFWKKLWWLPLIVLVAYLAVEYFLLAKRIGGGGASASSDSSADYSSDGPDEASADGYLSFRGAVEGTTISIDPLMFSYDCDAKIDRVNVYGWNKCIDVEVGVTYFHYSGSDHPDEVKKAREDAEQRIKKELNYIMLREMPKAGLSGFRVEARINGL